MLDCHRILAKYQLLRLGGIHGPVLAARTARTRSRSAGSWSPTRSPTGCCSPSRCAGGCGSGSAARGSPTARTSCCCTSRAATRWPTSRSAAVADGVLQPSGHTTRHRDLGPTVLVHGPGRRRTASRARRWQHTELPDYASELKGRVAFAWRAMDAFYEEDERIVGHAADPYHRIDIRQTSRHLVVRYGDRVVADTSRPAGPVRVRVRAALVRARATTSTRPRSPRPRARRSARTRAWPATTTSAARAARPGRTRTPGPRSGASPA